jgi:hypothetical protein
MPTALCWIDEWEANMFCRGRYFTPAEPTEECKQFSSPQQRLERDSRFPPSRVREPSWNSMGAAWHRAFNDCRPSFNSQGSRIQYVGHFGDRTFLAHTGVADKGRCLGLLRVCLRLLALINRVSALSRVRSGRILFPVPGQDQRREERPSPARLPRRSSFMIG